MDLNYNYIEKVKFITQEDPRSQETDLFDLCMLSIVASFPAE
jgi:hypothetical protein